MFKIVATPTYTAPVIVDLPADNGKTKEVTFTAKFRRLDQQEIEQLYENLGKKALTDRQIVDDVLRGWEGVADEQGQPLEFNQVNLEALLKIYPTQACIVSTYFKTIQGGTTQKEKEKNS